MIDQAGRPTVVARDWDLLARRGLVGTLLGRLGLVEPRRSDWRLAEPCSRV
jgi:hypothetical protein